MPVIEVLYFDGCPGAEPALSMARDVAARHTGAEVRAVRVEPENVDTARFSGSPTIRVDGVDIAPAGEVPPGFAMRCRVYLVEGGLQKVPPSSWLEAALNRLAGRP